MRSQIANPDRERSARPDRALAARVSCSRSKPIRPLRSGGAAKAGRARDGMLRTALRPSTPVQYRQRVRPALRERTV